jgi:hypothetical protein
MIAHLFDHLDHLHTRTHTHLSPFNIASLLLCTVLALFLRKCAFTFRSYLASLSDKNLSTFLTKGALFRGVLLGITLLCFVTINPIFCLTQQNGAPLSDYSQCETSLYSQIPLGFMLCIYSFKEIVMDAVPIQIKVNHTISIKKILTLENLGYADKIESSCSIMTLLAGIQLLAFFGTEGKLGE